MKERALRALSFVSVDLFGKRLADGFPFEVVAPLDRGVRAVAIGFVRRLSAAADDHAVADFVGLARLAPQGDAAANPQSAAAADGDILDQPETGLEAEFERLSRTFVPCREPAAGHIDASRIAIRRASGSDDCSVSAHASPAG